MNILLTNDDSHASPLLQFVLAALRHLGQVTIVVPKEEQSWTGKSMTRFTPLYLDKIVLGDDFAHCVDGTPADCANLGVYHIMPQKPDLVVSGINIGRNVGLAFMLSSGTIGACLEANLAGLPAVALSQDMAREVYQAWSTDRCLPEEEASRLERQTAMLLPRVFETLLAKADLRTHPVTWNVNLPFRAAADWRIEPASLGQSMYGSCFQRVGDRFQHALGAIPQDNRAHVDEEIIRQGHVSLTQLDLRVFGERETTL